MKILGCPPPKARIKHWTRVSNLACTVTALKIIMPKIEPSLQYAPEHCQSHHQWLTGQAGWFRPTYACITFSVASGKHNYITTPGSTEHLCVLHMRIPNHARKFLYLYLLITRPYARVQRRRLASAVRRCVCYAKETFFSLLVEYKLGTDVQ